MDLIRILRPGSPTHVPLHRVPRPLARHGTPLYQQPAILLDRNRSNRLSSLAYLYVAQHHPVSNPESYSDMQLTRQ